MVLNQLFIIFLFAIFPFLAFIFNKVLISEIIKDLRISRILHYLLLTFLGIAIGIDKNNYQTFFTNGFILNFVGYILCLIYAAVFAIISNNIEDLDTDKITNRERPLVKNTVDVYQYKIVGMVCLIISFVASLMFRLEMFFTISLMSLFYYFYSCKPFRFKKITFLSKFLIGINSLIASFYGFYLMQQGINNFPISWILYILIPLSISSNFVDIKDTEGDKYMNVKTLPVVFGEQNAKHIIGIMTALSYLLPSIILNIWWLFLLAVPMLVIHIKLLYRKPYKEKPIFITYLTSIFALILILITNSLITK